MGAFDLEPPEGEVGEVGIERGLGMPGEKPPSRRLLISLLGFAVERHPPALQRIAGGARAVEQDRGAGVVGEVLGVLGKPRNEKDRNA